VLECQSGLQFESLVIGRIFRNQLARARYVDEKLLPLAAQMRGRQEVAIFSTPVAAIEPLNAVAYVFPIDGELPTLVGATDRRRVVKILREALPAALGGQETVEDCRVELGQYGRQHRCVLRYHVQSRPVDRDAHTHRVVYGKVSANTRGALTGPVIAALRERVIDDGAHSHGGPYRFNVPRSFGFYPDLNLTLLEGIPGEPQLARLVKARSQGKVPRPESPALEEAIDACARIAAALHGSGIALGQPRSLADELATLRHGFHAVARTSPEIGAQFHTWLRWVEARAQETQPLEPHFSHGDFTYSQLIFDGSASGLVDFDTICQAEPALDLGQFLAYARVTVPRARHKAAQPADHITEKICGQFLDAYIEASAASRSCSEERLRARVPVYEVISLLRIGLHSWQKLKGTRLEYVISVLEERVQRFGSN
jgi:thiamine kinase-like enzyme